MCNRRVRNRLAIAIAATTLVSGLAVAQDNESTDLTGQDVTVDQLVDALNIRTRGIEARCAPYQEQMAMLTRGIGVQPKTADEVPAIDPVKTVSISAEFELNSAQLTSKAKELLTTVAGAFNEEELAAQCFQLAGHTCDLGDDAYNMELSRRRADTVREFLISLGVKESRLITTGYGETAPKYESREKNRRVELGALAPVTLEYQ